jgi:flagellar biosynthesis protein FlhG
VVFLDKPSVQQNVKDSSPPHAGVNGQKSGENGAQALAPPEPARLFPETKSRADAAPQNRVFAVAGGKGGVGKSLLAANLGVFFARSGKNTSLIDADLGCPNLHSCLGLKGTRLGLSDFLKNRVATLNEAAVETGVESLKLVGGMRDHLTIPNLTYFEKKKLIAAIPDLPSDTVFLDLSAGTSFNTIDLFLASSVGVLLALPEPTSVENLYRFLRAAVHRCISNVSKDEEVVRVLNEAEDWSSPLGMRSPADVLERIERLRPEVVPRCEAALEGLDLRLVVNQARRPEDARLAEDIARIVRSHFGLRMESLGALDYDSAAWRSVASRKILLEDFPQSAVAQGIVRLGEKLLGAS